MKGAYSLLFMTEDAIIAVRDPMGIRPLCLGMFRPARGKDAHVVASEPCAFDLIGAEFVRDVEPGEMVVIDQRGHALAAPPAQQAPRARCASSSTCTSRGPTRSSAARSVYEVRKALGQRLAEEHPVEADVVVPVPDSGVPAAIGYAAELGIPSRWASSARITSAARSSSRSSASVTSACA